MISTQTTIEAEDNVDRPCIPVEQTLKSNTELARRLDAFELGTLVTTESYSFNTAGNLEAPASNAELDQNAPQDTNQSTNVSEIFRLIS